MAHEHTLTSRWGDYRLPGVDFYGAVHKGLRYALCGLLLRMGQTDADDRAAIGPLVDDLTGLLYLCEAHAEHENNFVHRALEARMAGSSATRAREHAEQRETIASLHRLTVRVVDADDGRRAHLWKELQLRYATFVGDNLVHMSCEEQETQPDLEARYTQAELDDLHGRLVGAIGEDEMAAFMRMMLPAASPRERAQLQAIPRG